MSIGISSEHVELGDSLRRWAGSVQGPQLVRAAEVEADARFDEAWKAALGIGLPGIVVPEADGGAGGSVLDLAVALEASADRLVPGPLLGSAVASCLLVGTPMAPAVAAGEVVVGLAVQGALARRSGTVSGRLDVVLDVPSATHVLAPAGDTWLVVPLDRARREVRAGLDLGRRPGAVTLEAVSEESCLPVPRIDAARVRRTLVTLAAAEAAGVARWCLRTAVAHAGLREQFGRPIGSFQAVKHLCAQMLETAEAVTAAAWDAAGAAAGDPQQWEYAAEVAGAIALDGAVRVAQDCIQVLGGIGFTFEHDAHLYLRRGVALRSLCGGGDRAARTLADLALTGARRRLDLDLDGQDEVLRPRIRDEVAGVVARPEGERRAALVDAGLLTPHWPAPHGRGAGPVEQLVIDQELRAAGVAVPDLKIGGWALPTILQHGSAAQQERFVRPTLLGEVVWCQLFSEPGAGSDLASLRTRAVRVDGGWRLTGQKVWTSLAHEADWAICLARTDPEAPRHRGIGYFLVDMRSPGIEIRPLREMTGDALFNEVFLEDVLVPDDCLVGEEDGGWALARTTLADERVAMAGTKLDASVERAVELLAEGLADASLGDAERVRVGRAVALATVCTVLGVRSTLRAVVGRGRGAEAAVAKLLTVRNRQDASELVVDLLGERSALGGSDVVDEVHQMLLTRCLSIAGGTTQVLRNVAAERILGLPR